MSQAKTILWSCPIKKYRTNIDAGLFDTVLNDVDFIDAGLIDTEPITQSSLTQASLDDY